jgi:hypothetical protein
VLVLDNWEHLWPSLGAGVETLLDAAGELAGVRRRHAAYFTALATSQRADEQLVLTLGFCVLRRRRREEGVKTAGSGPSAFGVLRPLALRADPCGARRAR